MVNEVKISCILILAKFYVGLRAYEDDEIKILSITGFAIFRL